MILLIDNYDSFTYNLVQAFQALGQTVEVYRNDALSADAAQALNPEALVISPGPGRPEDAGISRELIRRFTGKIPVLGVCLGHQCIADVFGARIERAGRILHGKTSRIYHDSKTLYRGLRSPFVATRYHSLVVPEESLTAELSVSSHTSEGEIMGLRVQDTQTEGVQFHPESILTEEGPNLLGNFVAQLSRPARMRVS